MSPANQTTAGLDQAANDEVELQEIPPPIAVEEPVATLWRPKVTVWRVLFSATTLGLGTAKALLSALDETSSSPITIEWIGGVVVLLM